MQMSKIVSDQFAASLKNLMKMPGVPAKTMFAIRKIAKTISEESARYEEVRAAIIEEFAERDENGKLVMLSAKSVKIKQDSVKTAEAKLKDAGAVVVELPTISFSELGDNPTLTAEDIYYLEFIHE